MKINDAKIVKRWDSVMLNIGVEHITINTKLSDLQSEKAYYSIEGGISVDWMLSEAEYWLSCYYEGGHCRCDDRFGDAEAYKMWVSETGKLKRLIARLQKLDRDFMVVKW